MFLKTIYLQRGFIMKLFNFLFSTKLLIPILVIPFIFCGYTKTFSQTQDAPVKKTKGFIKTQGQDFVDADGNKVYLKGVGLGNWLLPEGYMWKFRRGADRPRRIEALITDMIGEEKAKVFWKKYYENYITEADIKKISELGFNSVRPALNARLFLDEDKEELVYNEESFKLLDNLIKWCEKYNIYVIIDMHGAPGGQTGENIDDSKNSNCGLFIDKKNQDRLEALWVKIADRYKDNTAVIAYDLLNEPLAKRAGGEEFNKELEPLYIRLAAAIRKVDKNHMFTVEGAEWSNDWSVFSKPFDDNMFYQFHYYCWSYPPNIYPINHFLKDREKFNTPVWVGETAEGNVNLYWGMFEYLESNNVGFSFWPWKKLDTTNTTYSIKLPEGWDKIVNYSRSQAPPPTAEELERRRNRQEPEEPIVKPSAEEAEKILNEFLENIKLENCEFFEDVVNATFRRVPAKIEAENYGYLGEGKSYSLLSTKKKSEFYRTEEPVNIGIFNEVGENRWRKKCEVAVNLEKTEWIAYDVNSLSDQELKLKVRAKSEKGDGKIEFSLGTQKIVVEVKQGDWTEIDAATLKIVKGKNPLKMTITEGKLGIDWIELK